MKGTIAILGCLLAAYTAPLFGNEVPLILEETIQLPAASPYWDVAPTWGGDYFWASSDADSLGAAVHWSVSDDGVSQLFRPPDGFGSVNHVTLFHGNQGQPTLLISRRSYSQPPYVTSSCSVGAYELSENPVLIRYEQFGGHYYTFPPPVEIVNFVGVGNAYPQPPPPDITTALRVSVVHDYTSIYNSNHVYSESRGNKAGRYRDFLTPLSLPLSIGWSWNYVHSNWGEADFSICSGWQDIRDSQGGAFTRMTYNQLFETVSDMEQEIEFDVPRFFVAATTFGNPRMPILLAKDFWHYVAYRSEGDSLWSIPVTGNTLLTAYLLHSQSSEQFLFWNGAGQLNIVMAETGEIWGQTSPLDSGFSEMKIIGRYHNETRRLVVRYGSELRIYRFGEPIITDADDARPELPSNLTLSAYPNPFNPTTMIALELPKAAQANLVIYDLTGRQVATLFDEQMSAGPHEFGFDGVNLPSGIYFARLSAGEMVWTQKLVLLK